MPTCIRKATADDAQAMGRVHVASWRTTYPGIVPEAALASLDAGEREAMWLQGIEERAFPILVAEVAGEVVGFASGGKLREPIAEFDGEIYAIYLLQSAQGQGIGRLLLRNLAQMLVDEGFRSAVVWVLAQNLARRFYERLGATLVKETTVRIGGADLPDLALGWHDLRILAGGNPGA
jgi:L-amino acid N-acyltransferase YncA